MTIIHSSTIGFVRPKEKVIYAHTMKLTAENVYLNTSQASMQYPRFT